VFHQQGLLELVIMMTNPFGDDWVDFPARQMQIDFEVSRRENHVYMCITLHQESAMQCACLL